MNLKQLLSLSLFCAGISIGSFAQDTMVLTLNQVTDMVMSENLDIKVAENNHEQARIEKNQSMATLLPDVNIYGDINRVEGLYFDQVSGTLQNTQGNFLNAYLNVNWNLTDVLSGNSDLKAKKNLLESQRLKLEFTKDQSLLYVLSKYMEVLQGYEQREILEQFYATQQLVLEQTQAFEIEGRVSAQDTRIQEAELYKVENMIAQNESIIELKMRELLWALNLNTTTPVVLESLDSYNGLPISVENDPAQLEQNISDAKAERTDLLGLQKDVEASQHDLLSNRIGYMPSLGVYFNYGSGYSSFQQNDFNTQFTRDNVMTSYGASITIPVFNGFAKRTDIAKARASYDNSQLALEKAESKLYLDISNTQLKISADEKAISSNSSLLNARTLIYEVENEKYKLNVSTNIQLSQAYRDYLESSLEVNRSKYQLIYDQLLLQYYLGRLRNSLE